MANVFFSYTHKDEPLRDELEVHLAMLKREGAISAWHDRKILAGGELNGEIDSRLSGADVILLLVSPDFLASAYCYDVEIRRAMEMHEQGLAIVIPIILRPCDWLASAPFAKLLAVPTDGRPVVKWPDRDDAWLNVVQQLRAALPKLQETKPIVQSAVERLQPSHHQGPRSSNLRIRKTFSDADKDGFLDEAFEYMARFFEGSLQELENRHSNLQAKYKRLDARSFTAAIYQNGKAVAKCGIGYGGSGGFGGGIRFSNGDSAPSNSFNESLSIEATDQALFLRPMGMGWSGGNEKKELTMDGAAEYYWEMLMAPLQR